VQVCVCVCTTELTHTDTQTHTHLHTNWLCVCVCTELELAQADISFKEGPYWFRDGTCSGDSSCNEGYIPFPYLFISISDSPLDDPVLERPYCARVQLPARPLCVSVAYVGFRVCV
jgi:hypothetical protein